LDIAIKHIYYQGKESILCTLHFCQHTLSKNKLHEKISINGTYIPRIDFSSMSSLPTTVVDKLQCFLEVLIPSAIVLKIRLKALEFSFKVKLIEELRLSQKLEVEFQKSKVKIEHIKEQ
jgi:hypothetical protein